MTKTKTDGLTEVLKVRLTPAGLEELDSIATAEGVNRSEALRRVLEWVVAEHKAGKIGKVDSATGKIECSIGVKPGVNKGAWLVQADGDVIPVPVTAEELVARE